MNARHLRLRTLVLLLAVALACAPRATSAEPKVIRPPDAKPEPVQPEPAPTPAKASAPRATSAAANPAVPKPGPAPAAASTRRTTGTKLLSLPSRRPIVLDALHVEGKTDAPRVLFVHAGPTVALEDAPAHPSYLRDDFTAALSSPVRVRVRGGSTPRATTTGGTR